jgi:hypothetical protein
VNKLMQVWAVRSRSVGSESIVIVSGRTEKEARDAARDWAQWTEIEAIPGLTYTGRPKILYSTVVLRDCD